MPHPIGTVCCVPWREQRGRGFLLFLFMCYINGFLEDRTRMPSTVVVGGRHEPCCRRRRRRRIAVRSGRHSSMQLFERTVVGAVCAGLHGSAPEDASACIYGRARSTTPNGMMLVARSDCVWVVSGCIGYRADGCVGRACSRYIYREYVETAFVVQLQRLQL